MEPYLLQYMGGNILTVLHVRLFILGILGRSVAYDYTYNVPQRIKVPDSQSGDHFGPMANLFAWSNEYGQIGACVLTRSTPGKERVPISEDLVACYTQAGLPMPELNSDVCCCYVEIATSSF